MAAVLALAAVCAALVAHESPAAAPPAALVRVAVVGSGGSGSAAVATLKREYPGRFHVTQFEADDQLGGLMHTRRWGKPTDWNEGMIDMGIVAAQRCSYAHVFDFLETEGIPTHSRRESTWDTVVGPDTDLFDAGPRTKRAANKAYRKLLTALFTYKGSLREFMRDVTPKLVASDPAIASVWTSTNRTLLFSTASLDSSTDHIGNVIASMNMTGNPLATAPVGGWTRAAEAASKHADRVLLSAKVTKIERGMRPILAWVQNGQPEQVAEFDKVIFTGMPRHVLEVVGLDDDEKTLLEKQAGTRELIQQYLVAHSDRAVVPPMRPEFGGETPFYSFTQMGLHQFPNGAEPPYLSYFESQQQFNDTVDLLGHPAPELIHATWSVPSWRQSSHRESVSKFLRTANGKGNVHYAGVWSADGRWLEGAWVTGVRAAREVAGARWNLANGTHATGSYGNGRQWRQGGDLPLGCKEAIFSRYALWMYEEARTPGVEKRLRHPIPTACFKHTGETPPYFNSDDEYEQWVRDFETFDDQRFADDSSGQSLLPVQLRAEEASNPELMVQRDGLHKSEFESILHSLRADGMKI